MFAQTCDSLEAAPPCPGSGESANYRLVGLAIRFALIRSPQLMRVLRSAAL